MRARRLLGIVAAAGILTGSLAYAQQQPGPNSTASTFAEDMEKAYQNSITKVVRVSVTQSAQAIVIRMGLGKEFEEWQAKSDQFARSGGGGGGGGRRGGSGGNPGGASGGGGGGSGRAGTRGAAPGGGTAGGGLPGFGGRGSGGGGDGGMSSQVRRFFLDLAEQERQKKDPSAESAEKISKFLGAALRVQVNPGGFQGELLAVPLDMQGHTLVLGGIFKEAQQDPKNPAMKLIMPDGTQREADFVGANLYAGYSIIKLKDAKGIDPVRWSEHRLTAGEMLMPITSGQSFVPMVFVNQRIGEPFSEDRLQADEQGNSRFERNGAFLMDVHGNLAAIVTTGGGWAGERFAISATRMQRELKYILEQNKDIEPRPLGITFQVPVPATGSSAPGSMPGRRAVQVQEVTPGSLAANAGVMKDDIILSIDGRPISELVSGDRAALPGLIKLQVDLATRTDEVPLIITRKGVEQTLKMQLK